MQRPRVIGKQFKLPLEEESLNIVYNNENAIIIDEKVFQDKSGDIVIFLKYELHAGATAPKEEDFFKEYDICDNNEEIESPEDELEERRR